MTKDPTLEETLDGLLHHRTPGPIVFFVEVGVSLLELFPVYVDDFVSRCFVFLEGGLTRLNDTRRVPGTRRKISKANLPEPWIQEYFPIWRKHPGQIPGRRGYSLDRPVAPIIGCVSRDGRYLAAIAWPEARSLGQVWHDCLHPRPAIGESYDGRRNRIVSRGRIYFLPNDEAALRSAFRRDFPDWRRPHPE